MPWCKWAWQSTPLNNPYPSTPAVSLHQSEPCPSSVIDATPSCHFTQTANVTCHHLSCACSCMMLSLTLHHNQCLFALSPLIPKYHPPSIIGKIPPVYSSRVPHHHHSHTLLPMALLSTTSCSHTLTFIPRFTCPCSNMHTADVRLWVCTHWAWDHIQPDTSHYHSFKTFLTFHTSILAFVCWFAHISHGLTFNLTHHTSTLSRISSNIFAVLFLMYGRCLIRLDMWSCIAHSVSASQAFVMTLVSSSAPDHCHIKHILPQCWVFEGLGNLIRAITQMPGDPHVVVCFFFFLFLFFRSNLLC